MTSTVNVLFMVTLTPKKIMNLVFKEVCVCMCVRTHIYGINPNISKPLDIILKELAIRFNAGRGKLL